MRLLKNNKFPNLQSVKKNIYSMSGRAERRASGLKPPHFEEFLINQVTIQYVVSDENKLWK